MRIWTVNLDKDLSKSRGRKVSKKMGFRDPKVDDIYKAARILHLKPQKEDKSYPKLWWRQNSSIEVDKKWTKIETLKRISKIMQKEAKSQ